MKILQINKFHYLKDGASRSYFETVRLLERQGHEVAVFSMRHPDNLPTPWSHYFIDQINYDALRGWRSRLKAAINIIYNRQAARNLEKLIMDFHPDVAHLHIVYHQLSPSIIRVLKKHKIPMVMTLHDYKIIAPNYTLFNKGRVSYRACGGHYYQCVIDKAVKNSYHKSLIAAVEAYIYHNILKTYDMIDVFIAPSEFMKKICLRYGVPAEKITVLSHFIPTDFLQPVKSNQPRENYILYVGRLSEEKGVKCLLHALPLIKKNLILKIVGTGPQKDSLKSLAQSLHIADRVEFLGTQDSHAISKLMRLAQGTVIPSVWLEVFGYVAIESLVQQTPVIAAKIGALPEVVKDGVNGLLFSSGNSADLAVKINNITTIKLDYNLQKNKIIEQYDNKNHYKKLISIYNKVLDKNLIIF